MPEPFLLSECDMARGAKHKAKGVHPIGCPCGRLLQRHAVVLKSERVRRGQRCDGCFEYTKGWGYGEDEVLHDTQGSEGSSSVSIVTEASVEGEGRQLCDDGGGSGTGDEYEHFISSPIEGRGSSAG